MLQSAKKSDRSFRYYLRIYFDHIPLVRPGKNILVGILVIASVLLTTYYWAQIIISSWGYSSSLKSTSYELENAKDLSGIQFSPNGQLMGIRQAGRNIWIGWWNQNSGKLEASDSSILWAPTDLIQHSSSRSAYQFSLDRLQSPPIAISWDCSRLAWVRNGKLHVMDLKARTTGAPTKLRPVLNDSHFVDTEQSLSLRFDNPVVGLAFVNRDLVFVQDLSNKTSFVDIKEKRIIYSRQQLSGPCIAKAAKGYLLLACLRKESLAVYDVSHPPKVKEKWYLGGSGALALALSTDGQPAIATDTGIVVLFQSRNNIRDSRVELKAPGVVQALAYESGRIIVGGGFRGIHLLHEEAAPQELISDIAGVTQIVIQSATGQNGHFAYMTRDRVGAAVLNEVRIPNQTAFTVWMVWLIFSCVYISYPAVRGIWYEVRKRRQVRLKSTQEQATSHESEPEGPKLNLPDPPEELVQACAAENCVAYLGAGMGAQSGFPTWRPLIQGLLLDLSKNAENTHITESVVDDSLSTSRLNWKSLNYTLLRGQTDLVADGIVSRLGGTQTSVNDYLRRTFITPTINLPPAYLILKELGLSAVLTTNYDNLLDNTFPDHSVYTHRDAEKLLECLTRRQFFLLKLYGALEKPETVLLAPAQYVEAMTRNLLFSQSMESLFFSRTLLFLGTSLEGIEAYLSGIKFHTAMPQKHFALVNVVGTSWQAKADLLFRRFGTQVLPYTATEGFPELVQFLERLSQMVRQEVGRAKVVAPELSRLKSVRLINIGPFDDLHIDFDRNWNILLGDNGVGKSTILKAIAVGICGKDAEPYAARLIKTGKTDAMVVLESSTKKQYVTTIRRRDQRAEVTIQPSRPLEAEGWLALGFPALRTITWARTRELPPEGVGRPTAEDLLPLISGDSDPRLDKLKAWVVNLDYLMSRSEVESNTGRSERRNLSNYYRELLQLFFKIVDDITPGIKIKFDRVDAETKEVIIVTDDGPVPIESVSQGTASLLGWLGVLLQRMYEMYGERSSVGQQPSAKKALSPPQERHAVVLIDELDAHMHPKWQRDVPELLKAHFPNIQFIATTHSPLIVVGLKRSEVHILRREKTDSGQSKVIIEQPKVDPTGWYPDQVLTSQLFGLESTLAPDLAKAVDRYTELAARDESDLNSNERQELTELAQKLNLRLPAPHERQRARDAFELLEGAMDERLAQMPVERQRKILEEAKVQLQEFITGSRRPG